MSSPEPETPAAAPFASVIVPVRNDPEGLRRCVEALAEQTYAANRFEVIVVDDGSEPPVDSSWFEPRGVRVVHQPPRGSYAARNAGISAARGEVFAFTDADCLPDRMWLDRGVQRLGEAHGGVVVAGSIEMVPGGNPAIELFEKHTTLRQTDYVEQGDFAATASMLAPRRAFDDAGPFDATLQSGGDVEWCRRAARAGFPLVFEPTALIRHPTSRSMRQVLSRARRLARAYEAVAHDAGTFYVGPPRPGWRPPQGRRVLVDLAPPVRLARSLLAGREAEPSTRLAAVGVAVWTHYAAVGESISAKLRRLRR